MEGTLLLPESTEVRVGISGRSGVCYAPSRIGPALALALAADAPVHVSDPLMERFAVPVEDGDLLAPFLDVWPPPDHRIAAVLQQRAFAIAGQRPRFEPRNMGFAYGLDRWDLDLDLVGVGPPPVKGRATPAPRRRRLRPGTTRLRSRRAPRSSPRRCRSPGVPPPWSRRSVLGQEVLAEDYRGATITFSGEFRADAPWGRSGPFLRANEGHAVRGPLVEADLLADPDNNVTPVPPTADWTRYEVTARVEDDLDAFVFGIFLAASGRLRHPELRPQPSGTRRIRS